MDTYIQNGIIFYIPPGQASLTEPCHSSELLCKFKTVVDTWPPNWFSWWVLLSFFNKLTGFSAFGSTSIFKRPFLAHGFPSSVVPQEEFLAWWP
jgi:hypothetical protein